MFFGGKIVVWTSNEWILVKIFKIRDVPFFGLFNEFENTQLANVLILNLSQT